MKKGPLSCTCASLLLLVLAGVSHAQNTNLGTNAGNAGTNNTSIGAYAGDVVTGNYNSFQGAHSGRSNASAHSNTFAGVESGYSVTTGSYNSFFGRRAGFSTNGQRNCYFGYGASYYGTSGDLNVHMGYLAGSFNAGSNNVFVGAYAGYNASSASGNVFIGYGAGQYEYGSNKLYIANSWGTGIPLIYGDFATGSVGLGSKNPGSYRLYVNGDAFATGLWVSSDKRLKRDIKEIPSALEKVTRIHGVSYRFNQVEFRKSTTDAQLGLIAQEIQEVLPELVREDGEGYLSVNYQSMIPVLVEAIKELNVQNQALKSELTALKVQLNNSEGKVPSTGNSTRSFLHQNTPNPFKGTTTIKYYLEESTASIATVYIHDLQGKQVMVFEHLSAGDGELTLDGNKLGAGLYYYTMVVNGNILDSKKMLLTE